MTLPVEFPCQRPNSTFWGSLMRSKLAGTFMKRAHADAPALEPLHCDTPRINGADVAAVYFGERVAGDFYEVLRVGSSRVVFVMLDIAGLRADTREILVSVQRTFRERSSNLFAEEDFNETGAVIQLCYEMNQTIIERGVRSCPAFIGCYNEDVGTVCYANAGHTPALLRDRSGISLLAATGLPLGLFTHTTQGANTYRLEEESALLLVSRGVVEAISFREDADSGLASDFGMAGVVAVMEQAPIHRAYGLCLAMLRSAQRNAPPTGGGADLTTLALVRNAKGELNEYESPEPA